MSYLYVDTRKIKRHKTLVVGGPTGDSSSKEDGKQTTDEPPQQGKTHLKNCELSFNLILLDITLPEFSQTYLTVMFLLIFDINSHLDY